jgi:hypothetical protein
MEAVVEQGCPVTAVCEEEPRPWTLERQQLGKRTRQGGVRRTPREISGEHGHDALDAGIDELDHRAERVGGSPEQDGHVGDTSDALRDRVVRIWSYVNEPSS